MKAKLLPPIERLVELFYYDFRDNNLHWRISRVGCRRGDVVGYTRKDGRCLVGIDGKQHYVYRVIYKLCTGEEPDVINHIDRNQSNNSLHNLESDTQKHNTQPENSRGTRVELPLPPGVIMSHVWYREKGLPIPDEAKTWRKKR